VGQLQVHSFQAAGIEGRIQESVLLTSWDQGKAVLFQCVYERAGSRSRWSMFAGASLASFLDEMEAVDAAPFQNVPRRMDLVGFEQQWTGTEDKHPGRPRYLGSWVQEIVDPRCGR